MSRRSTTRGSCLAAVAALLLAGCGGSSPGPGTPAAGSTTTTAPAGEAAQRATLQRYFAAVAAGQPTSACAELTEASRERLAEYAKPLHAAGEGCEATMQVVLASRYGQRLAQLRHPVIDRVDVKGSRATATVDGVDGRLELAREDAGWRIDFTPSVEADKLPGGPKEADGGKDANAG